MLGVWPPFLEVGPFLAFVPFFSASFRPFPEGLNSRYPQILLKPPPLKAPSAALRTHEMSVFASCRGLQLQFSGVFQCASLLF